MSDDLKAKVTAHKGVLVLDLIATKSSRDTCTISLDTPGVIGQVIHNTKKHLGVSEEALALLGKVKSGRDSIGDVDWFMSNDGHANFAWLGGPKALVNPNDSEAARGFRVLREHAVVIPNDVPPEAAAIIDQQ